MTLGVLVSLYLLATLALGLVATRLVSGVGDFFSANRKLPLMLSSFDLFALWFGSETVFGASSEFIKRGLLGVIEDPFGATLCLLLFGLFLARPLYRQNLLTLGDLFRKAYGPHTEYLSALFMILTFITYIAGQLLALSILFKTIFGLDPAYGLMLGATIVTLYTAGGGMWAVSLTDFVQSIVIMIGMVTICVFLSLQTDFSRLWVPPRPGFFDFFPSDSNGVHWSEYCSAWLTLGLGSLASQDIFQRANASSSEQVAVRSTFVGAGLYFGFALLPLLMALMVFQLEPQLLEGDQQDTLIQLVTARTPLWLQGVFFGALLSAVFSTCSGALLAPSSIMAENLVKPLLGDNESQLLKSSRWCVVLMAVIATATAFASDSIYELVGQSSALGAVSILVPMLFALFGKQPSARGALLSMTAGLAVYLVCEFAVKEFPVPAMFMGILASLAGMLLGNAMQGAARTAG
ncbi:MAG TPA: sodium:solute symporter family protein [Candidatus Acidoferrum sp.]|nr:sodium:solute symporter family protein [Candidatus Acidoferrum sp.]